MINLDGILLKLTIPVLQSNLLTGDHLKNAHDLLILSALIC